MTSDTNDFDTPARWAPSRIVGRRPFDSLCSGIPCLHWPVRPEKLVSVQRTCPKLDRSKVTRLTVVRQGSTAKSPSLPRLRLPIRDLDLIAIDRLNHLSTRGFSPAQHPPR